MEINSVNNIAQEAKELIAAQKAQILEKLKKGETEQSIVTGGSSFTESEWRKLIDQIDETLEVTKKEQEERFTKMEEQAAEKDLEDKLLMEKQLKDELFEKESLEAKRRFFLKNG